MAQAQTAKLGQSLIATHPYFLYRHILPHRLMRVGDFVLGREGDELISDFEEFLRL
jgi:hypothetical protein